MKEQIRGFIWLNITLLSHPDKVGCGWWGRPATVQGQSAPKALEDPTIAFEPEWASGSNTQLPQDRIFHELMNSWPFFISFSQIPSVGSMHTSKGNTDSSANPSYTDINKQELCWSFAGTAAFPHTNEEFISQVERHVKSHVGDGCLQGLNVQGMGHTWDLFGYFASSKLDTNLRIHI